MHMDRNNKGTKRWFITLDVGGTEIKAGIMNEDGELKNPVVAFPSRSCEDMNGILDNFAFILEETAATNDVSLKDMAGVGMAFPGPFDYGKGISLMKGLKKYDAIYGIGLEEEIKKRTSGLNEIPFTFVHDIESFSMGEYFFGKVQGAHKVFCICVGTGAGSAFLVDGQPSQDAGEGVPQRGGIYHFPYQEGIIDDYLSVRGLARLSKNVTGESMSGKQLSELSERGDKNAAKVWRQFGDILVETALPFVETFQPDVIVMGGQISRSFHLFGNRFEKECRQRGVKIITETEASLRAMQGLIHVMKERRRIYGL